MGQERKDMIIISSNSKVLVVMRGVAGSGKSTKAKELGKGGVILGSDDFFMKKGRYEFDSNKIGIAHAWNLNRAQKFMAKGISPIVIDNTNVAGWQAKPYVEAGLKYGYQIRIEEPDSPWWQPFKKDMSPEEFERLVKELTSRNKHGVPEDVIRKMLAGWEHGLTVDKILQSQIPSVT